MPLNAAQFSPQGPGIDYDPHWYRRAVFYEVLVRAFADGNGDGSGDFTGLIERLDYLQWLGIEIGRASCRERV